MRDTQDAAAREVVDTTTVVDERKPRPAVNWGAIIAGLFFILAFTYLMTLLGSAIGLGIADAYDTHIFAEGFGIGSVVWMAITGIVAYLIGGLLAARLASNTDEKNGAIQGLALWAVATIVLLVFEFWIISHVVATGVQAVQATASAAGGAVSTAAQAVAPNPKSFSQTLQAAADTEMAEAYAARLKRKTAEAMAESESPGGPDVTQSEARTAIESIDQETFEKASAELVDGDQAGAKQVLANETDLSQAQINELIDGISETVAQSETVEQAQQQLQQAADTMAKRVARMAGPNVSADELQRSVRQLDLEEMRKVGAYLVQGKTEAAKNTLALNTDLSEAEVEAIVTEANEEVQEQIDVIQKEANQTVEAVNDYTQNVLWTMFVSCSLSLIAAMLGGLLGAKSVHRINTMTVDRHAERAAVKT